ncbi:MAG TPA: TorF family putative porin [Methylophilaceae bacterium]|nr:TorF family putative porin [Methylophilaceae bacterium]
MRKSLLMMAVLGAISAPAAVFAEEAAAETPAYTLTYNIGLFSSYQFRGLEQTGGRAALQGGVDWTHASGFYLGAWGSNVSWLQDAGAYQRSSVEIDLYGGYRNTIPNTEIGYDISLLQYLYPGDRNAGFASANTLEGAAGLTYKWLGVKYWYIFTDAAYGLRDARGTDYIDLNLNVPIADTGITALFHVGRQEFNFDPAGADLASYTDYKIGLAKAWANGVTLGGYYTDTDAKRSFYTDASGNYVADDKVTVYVQKTF